MSITIHQEFCIIIQLFHFDNKKNFIKAYLHFLKTSLQFFFFFTFCNYFILFFISITYNFLIIPWGNLTDFPLYDRTHDEYSNGTVSFNIKRVTDEKKFSLQKCIGMNRVKARFYQVFFPYDFFFFILDCMRKFNFHFNLLRKSWEEKITHFPREFLVGEWIGTKG